MANELNRDHWNRSGQSWVAHQRTFDCVLAPIGALLLDGAGFSAGQRVLDVGCGYGTTTLGASLLGVHVHGVDISTPMVEAARQRVPGATFEVADAQTDPLGGPYDVVISRFGVMFFDDPLAAFTNIATHTAIGGRMTFACWNVESLSSAVWAGSDVLRAALAPSQPPNPYAPGPFALANADRTTRILSDAGWTDISMTAHELPCSIGWADSDGVEERLAVVLASEAGQLMREHVPAADQPALIEAARQSLRARVVDGALRLHASIWLVAATR